MERQLERLRLRDGQPGHTFLVHRTAQETGLFRPLVVQGQSAKLGRHNDPRMKLKLDRKPALHSPSPAAWSAGQVCPIRRPVQVMLGLLIKCPGWFPRPRFPGPGFFHRLDFLAVKDSNTRRFKVRSVRN